MFSRPARSFRVIYPPVGRQPPRFQFPVLPDRFHTTYPASSDEYLKQSGVRHGVNDTFSIQTQEDRITQLPAEVFVMIFSSLSVAELDAARYVCHRWWDRIMASNHVLFEVLHIKSVSSARARSAGSLGSYAGKRNNHRQLARGLDHEGAALATLRLEDSWRSRYRRCDLEFSFPKSLSVEEDTYPWGHLRHTFSSARFSSTGSFILFATRDSIDSAQAGSQASRVLFYHISRSGRPVYVDSIPGPRGHAVMDAVQLREIEQGRSWVGTVQIGTNFIPFSIKLRQGWLDTCSPYVLTPLDTSDGMRTFLSLPGDEENSQPVIKKALSNSKKPWRLLGHIPSLTTGHDNHGRPQRPYYIATRSDTDELWIIGFDTSQSGADFVQRLETDFDAYDGTHRIYSSVNLSPPHLGSLYRNVAVAPSLLHDSLLRVAVVWQLWTQRTTNSPPELYYYDLHKTPDGISSPHINSGYTQGKRVSSLGRRMGGLSQSSPVRKMRYDTESSYFDEASMALGGLELIQIPGEFRDCEEQKLIAWGLSETVDTNRIRVTMFDLSYSDPKRMEYVKHLCARFAPYGRQNGVQESISDVCACSLHDHGYHVVLPDLWPGEAPKDQGPPTWTQWLQRGAGSPPPKMSAGTVTLYESPARVEALERNEEVLRERIREMKRTPMTDEQIAQEWQGCWWTRWNAVVKPDDWKLL